MKVYGGLATKPIRTYNFKRGTVTDHRTGVSLPLRDCLAGKIELLTMKLRTAFAGK